MFWKYEWSPISIPHFDMKMPKYFKTVHFYVCVTKYPNVDSDINQMNERKLNWLDEKCQIHSGRRSIDTVKWNMSHQP